MSATKNNNAWMKRIFRNFTKLMSLVVDACAGISFVSEALLLLQKNRRLTECENNPSFVHELTPQLMLIYAQILLSNKLDFHRDEYGRRSTKVGINALKGIGLQMHLYAWQVL